MLICLNLHFIFGLTIHINRYLQNIYFRLVYRFYSNYNNDGSDDNPVHILLYLVSQLITLCILILWIIKIHNIIGKF